jgi:hypothetical protein
MKLQLKPEPLALRIRGMEGGPLETVHVDPRSTVSEVIQLCSRKLGGVLSWSVFSLMKEGGRMEGESDGTTRFSLLFQEGMKMSQCNPDSILPESEIIHKCVTESVSIFLLPSCFQFCLTIFNPGHFATRETTQGDQCYDSLRQARDNYSST